VGFLRGLWFPQTGKVEGWVRINIVKKVITIVVKDK
jgi:hypothetical protein